MNRDVALTTDVEAKWPVQPYDMASDTSSQFGPALDLPALLRIFREWRWLILAAVAAGLVLGILYAMVITPMYRASVILQVNPPTVEIMDDNNGDQTQAPTTWGLVATQVGLLSSSSLAERVAQNLNLANNPHFVPQEGDPETRLTQATQEVEDGLTVEPPGDAQLIKFSFASDSPSIAAQVANGLAEAFINSNLQRHYESSSYARKFLEGQIAKTRAELEKSERQLVGYAQAQGIINTATDQNSNVLETDANSPTAQSLIDTNKELSDATARRVAAEGAYRAALSSGVTPAETSSTQALTQARASLQAQYQQNLTQMKPDHPQMVGLRSQIAELDRQISRETSEVQEGRINGLRSDYEAAAAAEHALQAKVAELKSNVLDLRGRSIRYAILQRDVDTNRTLYDALLQRYKEIGVAGGIGTAPVSIVDRADPPTKPFKPSLPMDLVVGLALGLLAGAGAAIALEYLNDTIKTREDVRTKLGLACLGTVPKRAGKANFLDDLKEPTSAISEAYSTVAASLGFSTESGIPKVLLITSSRAAEGKSSSALALAQNYSRRGKSVLLIDCDLRKPAFKSSSDKFGLTKMLTNHDPVALHVSATYLDNLWLLAAGPVPPNPADLLSTGRFQAIVREASAQFDIIVIDAPPVIGLADAPLIASICKDVMFIVESGKTRTSAAREAISKLESAGAHVIGVVLTKSMETHHGYGYAYGYGYKHRYGAVDKNRTEITLIPDNSEA